jgi:nucleotide-binding universal stress UspA family protein
MFKKILWATDGSEAADLALPVVKELAAIDGGQVVVFHSDVRMVGPHSYGYPAHVNESELKEKIRQQAEDLGDAGIDAAVDIVATNTIGGAAHDIADAAARHEADVILVGSRGHTPIAGLLLGSVTQRLLHLASCPVMVVPAEVATASPSGGSHCNDRARVAQHALSGCRRRSRFRRSMRRVGSSQRLCFGRSPKPYLATTRVPR